MPKRKRTGWYPPSIPPLADRPGWYERRWGFGVDRDWWDGRHWLWGPRSERHVTFAFPWRGLTAPKPTDGGGDA